MWIAVGNGHGGDDALEHVLLDLEAIGLFSAELGSRLGVDADGIGALARLRAHLRRSLDAIPTDELQRAHAETQRLIQRFKDVARALDELQRLKRLVGA